MSVKNNNRKITQLPKVTSSAMTNDDIYVFVHSGTTAQGTLGDMKEYIAGDLTDTYSTGGTFNETGSTITIDNNQGGSFAITGITSVPSTQFWIVDPLNGDDNTGIYGSYSKPFSTISAAESGATAGDVIKIVSDIKECGMGKDGITYIVDKGVKVYYPASDSTPSGLISGHLWSDSKAGVAISFTVYGGTHEGEGNWYGNSDRGIIRNNYGSTIKLYDTEKIFAKGSSQDLLVTEGTGGDTQIHCNGDIISGLNGVQFSNSINSNVVISAQGKVQTELRKVGAYGSSEGNTLLIESATEIVSLGHNISGLRSVLYANTGQLDNQSHWILKAPKITYYDEFPNLGSSNGAYLFGWDNMNVKLDIVADIFTMSNIDPITYTNEAGMLALNYTNSNARYNVTLDINTIILGQSHEFDDTSYNPNRTNAMVKLKNCEIITMTPLVQSGNIIDTINYTPSFEGACKIIMNPDAITAGQKAIGSSSGNDAWVMGHMITNGDYYDGNFTDLFSGNVGVAINNIKVNDSSEITNFDNYKNIL